MSWGEERWGCGRSQNASGRRDINAVSFLGIPKTTPQHPSFN